MAANAQIEAEKPQESKQLESKPQQTSDEKENPEEKPSSDESPQPEEENNRLLIWKYIKRREK